MAFVAENGSGLSNANGYITVAFFKEYHGDRGRDSSAFGTTQIQQAIVVSSDFLDAKFTFIGMRKLTTQSMEWPRTDAFYMDGRIASGVPVEVSEATAELAFKQLTSEVAPDPTYDPSNRLVTAQKNKVGPIEQDTKFTDGGSPILFRSYPLAERKLKELIVNGSFVERV